MTYLKAGRRGKGDEMGERKRSRRLIFLLEVKSEACWAILHEFILAPALQLLRVIGRKR